MAKTNLSSSPQLQSSPPFSAHFNQTFFWEEQQEQHLLFMEQHIDEQEMQTRANIKLVFCIIYGLLFVLGTLGNGLVIVMICNVMLTLSRSRRKASRKLLMASAEHVFIYVLGLSIVDLFVILHLPLLIFEMREGQWPFGEFMCKLYWFGESVNKLLSSFLMTVLSWDRYMAVCSPIKSMKMRTNSVAITVLISCSVVATLLLYPVLKESTVLRVNKMTGLRLVDDDQQLISSIHEDEEQRALLMSSSPDSAGSQPIVLKCVFDTNSPLFMLYTFAAGYLVPALLIIFFYLRVILKLRADAISVRKQTENGQIGSLSSARFHKVTKRIVAVILFYFFCWTPYWTLNIMSQFGVIIVSWSTLTLSSVFFAAHLLVCFNSAANPVLYALINRELRQQNAQAFQKRRRSLHNATNNALGFIEKQFPSREGRLSSVGEDNTQLRLLGNGMVGGGGTTGQQEQLNGGLTGEKRSNSFSHCTPVFSTNNKNRRQFGSSHYMHPIGGREEERKMEEKGERGRREEEEEVGERKKTMKEEEEEKGGRGGGGEKGEEERGTPAGSSADSFL